MGKGGGKSAARGGGGSGGARGGRTGGGSNQSTYQSNPSVAPVGTKLSMGGYTYTKINELTWVTYKNGKKVRNRTNADIKRVFA